MAVGMLQRLRLRHRRSAVGYDEAKRLARDGNPRIRCELAKRPELKPEILYFLASDEDAEVRRAIAANGSTPLQADIILATDKDEAVRSDLAAKIASIAPHLTQDEQDVLCRMAVDVLEILARDQATRVRQILAEALKDVANAPPNVIKRLAKDVELVVAGPVLQNSPVLSEEDLVAIVRGDHAEGALTAISRRRGLDQGVCDALVDVGDVDAITSLLGNHSAQIREETLDLLVDQAPEVETWHAPLVRRPRLSSKATQRLARFVAHSLLEVLQDRQDLDPNTARAVAEVVDRRIAEEAPDARRDGQNGRVDDANVAPGASAEARARRLHGEKKLSEAEILTALGHGDRAFATASIAVLADVPMALVEQVVSMQSAKGMVSLAWKAQLSMKLAIQLQMRLAGISPREVLKPTGGYSYPLTEADMEWQLDFFHGMLPQT
jgi:uncharacterized protein (DUF2336 family)